jgi:hypothetical protein
MKLPLVGDFPGRPPFSSRIFQPCLMKPKFFLGRLNGSSSYFWRWVSSSYRPLIHHESWIFPHLSGKSSSSGFSSPPLTTSDCQREHVYIGTEWYPKICMYIYIYIIIFNCVGLLRNLKLYIIYNYILYCTYGYIYILDMHTYTLW